MKKILRSLIFASSLLLAACSGGSSVDPVAENKSVKKVELSQNYLNLSVGESETLTVTLSYYDDKEHNINLIWLSGDNNVATVSNGVVTAVAAGTTYISCRAGYQMAACTVTVSGDEHEFDISLNQTSINLIINETYQLVATTSEAAAISWDTGNPNVATVSSDGLVSAKGAGTTSISATANGTTASCVVVVEETGGFAIRLNSNSISLGEGENYQLIATTTEVAEISWVSSNSSVASVSDSGLVTAISEGTAIITASANDKSATCTVEVAPIDDDELDVTIYFFIDYNNINTSDTTGKQMLAKFKWYSDRPISESGKVPANPTTSMDPAFPYFIGWSDHTIIDTKDDLWDMSKDTVGSAYYLYLYGIWSDVQQGEFTK